MRGFLLLLHHLVAGIVAAAVFVAVLALAALGLAIVAIGGPHRDLESIRALWFSFWGIWYVWAALAGLTAIVAYVGTMSAWKKLARPGAWLSATERQIVAFSIAAGAYCASVALCVFGLRAWLPVWWEVGLLFLWPFILALCTLPSLCAYITAAVILERHFAKAKPSLPSPASS